MALTKSLATDMQKAWSSYRQYLLMAVVLAIIWIAVAWFISDRYRQQHAQQEIQSAQSLSHQLADGIALDLRNLLSSKQGLVLAVANAPYVRQYILQKCGQTKTSPATARLPDLSDAEINGYLTSIAGNLGANILFLGSAQGYGIASANANTSHSTIGQNYSDRAYFHQVREGHLGYQYAVGRVTGMGGLFFAAPIMDAGQFCGFAVLKTDISSLSVWLNQAEAFLVDENGVVIGARDKTLELKTLPDATVDNLEPKAIKQRYGKAKFERITLSPLLDKRYPDLKLLRGNPTPLIVHQVEIPEYRLKLVVTQSLPHLAELDHERNVFFLLFAGIGLLLSASGFSAIAYVKQIRYSRHRFQEIAERLEAAASAGIVGVWDWDIVSDSLVWDKVMYSLYGLREADFEGAYAAWASAVHPEDKERVEAEINAAFRGEREYAAEFRVVWPDGSIHHLKAVSRTTFDERGQPLRMVGVNYDLTEQKSIQAELDRMAYYDRLTTLPNRRMLEDRLEQSLARAAREACRLSLLFIDLDKFKQINDVQGHEAGDWLLQQVARRMKDCLRASDTAARIGGDEFIVLLPDIKAIDEAVKVAEKIRLVLEQPFVMDDGQALDISSSIGVVLYPDHADNMRDLLRFGDEAMYNAKRGGRNAVIVFERETKGNAIELHWSAALACGEPTIDREHEELFRKANKLLAMTIRKEASPEQLTQEFDELLTSVAQHFAAEEAILRAHNYQSVDAHAALHRALLKRARELRRDSEEARLPISKVVEFVVSEIIGNHILTEDRKFFASL